MEIVLAFQQCFVHSVNTLVKHPPTHTFGEPLRMGAGASVWHLHANKPDVDEYVMK